MIRSLATLLVLVVLAAGCAPVDLAARRDHPLLSREAGVDGPASSPLWKPVVDDAVPARGEDIDRVRARIAAAAAASLGDRPIIVGGIRYRFDCSGVAAGIYARAGLPILEGDGAPDTRSLFELARRHGSLRKHHPLVGDFVFFDDTWDANGNGRIDDPLSHVGVVERIEDDGTVIFVHRVGRRIVRGRLNLSRPHDRADEKGRPLNHWLRAAEGAHPARTTGELFVAFGTLALGENQGVLARR